MMRAWRRQRAAWPGLPSWRWSRPMPSRADASASGMPGLAGDVPGGVVVAERLAGVGGGGGQVAEEGQRFGLAEPASKLAVELEREAQAGGSGRVVTGQQLHEAEVVDGGGFQGPARRDRRTWPGSARCLPSRPGNHLHRSTAIPPGDKGWLWPRPPGSCRRASVLGCPSLRLGFPCFPVTFVLAPSRGFRG